MTTLILHIRADDRWNQSRWSDFFNDVNHVIISYPIVAIYRGTSLPTDKIARACWIIEMESMDDLEKKLSDISAKYDDNKVNILVGHAWIS